MPNHFKLLVILICLYFFFFRRSIKILELDNHMNLYENNHDFSKFKTDIKAIAIYNPFINWNMIIKIKTNDIESELTRERSNNYTHIITTSVNIIKKQIQLAKSHGLYGFAINYNGNSYKYEMDSLLDIFNNNEINFHFFLILEDDNFKKLVI